MHAHIHIHTRSIAYGYHFSHSLCCNTRTRQLIKEGFFPFRLIVIQPLLGAVLFILYVVTHTAMVAYTSAALVSWLVGVVALSWQERLYQLLMFLDIKLLDATICSVFTFSML